MMFHVKSVEYDDCFYSVYGRNEIDAEFGYDPGKFFVHASFDKAVAKSIARHMNKCAEWFESYWVECSDPEWF